MTPIQKLKFIILSRQGADILSKLELDVLYGTQGPDFGEIIDDLFESCKPDLDLQEARCAGIDTGLKGPFNRNYECKVLAAKTPDETWIAWNFWYGGGKHGYPEDIPWIESAFEIRHRTETREVDVFWRED